MQLVRGCFYTLIFLLASLTSAFASAQPEAKAPLQHSLGFSLEFPEGFNKDDSVLSQNPELLFAFSRSNGPDTLASLIVVEKLKGTIGRERLTSAHLAKGSKARLMTHEWNGFTIDGVELPEPVDGVQYVSFSAQIPLSPHAVQLSVFGPESERTALIQTFERTLGTVKGPTNWIASVAPPKTADSSAYGVIIGAVAFLLIASGLVVVWIKRHGARKGVLLCAGVVLLVGSWAVPRSSVRELLVLRGSFRLFATGTILLGLADLFIPRRKPQAPESLPPGTAA
jgi:hypothetical protein